jgi:hypothetical protein
MSDSAKTSNDNQAQEGGRNFFKGTVTSGDYKGKPFVVYLGESPKKSRLSIDNEVIPCRKIEVVVDWKESITTIKFECRINRNMR